MYIYKITNTINPKVYVGQSVTRVSVRWSQHKNAAKSGRNRPLYRAMQKYGHDKFKFEVVEILPYDISLEELNARERFWIKELKSFYPDGYNLTSGGDGKFFLAEETKIRIGAANAGREKSQDEVRRISESLKGNKNKAGKPISEEAKIRISQVQLGKKDSEETKLRKSESHRGAKAYNAKAVECVETGIIYESTGHAARTLSLDTSSVGAVCRGERKSTGGFHFTYINEPKPKKDNQ